LTPPSRAPSSDQTTFDDFVEHCAELIREAGIAASLHSRDGKNRLLLDATKTWLNMPMLLALRSSPSLRQRPLEIATRMG